MAEASRNFTEIMLALAVLDLPFEAKEPATAFDGSRMTMTAGSPTIAFHKEIRKSALDKDATPLLVSQNFFRASGFVIATRTERSSTSMSQRNSSRTWSTAARWC